MHTPAIGFLGIRLVIDTYLGLAEEATRIQDDGKRIVAAQKAIDMHNGVDFSKLQNRAHRQTELFPKAIVDALDPSCTINRLQDYWEALVEVFVMPNLTDDEGTEFLKLTEDHNWLHTHHGLDEHDPPEIRAKYSRLLSMSYLARLRHLRIKGRAFLHEFRIPLRNLAEKYQEELESLDTFCKLCVGQEVLLRPETGPDPSEPIQVLDQKKLDSADDSDEARCLQGIALKVQFPAMAVTEIARRINRSRDQLRGQAFDRLRQTIAASKGKGPASNESGSGGPARGFKAEGEVHVAHRRLTETYLQEDDE